MKNAIKLIALFLVLSTGAFAATPVKNAKTLPLKDYIIFKGLSSVGIKIGLLQNVDTRSTVVIKDKDSNVLYKGKLSGKAGSEKTYNLSALENGDYVVTVSSNHQDVSSRIHIYDEDGNKTYFFIQ